MERTLGDHGIRHTMGDADHAIAILRAVPGVDRAEDALLMQIAGAIHDTGYLTTPARIFLDSEHPRWAAQYYRENFYPLVARLVGTERADMLERIIATHSETAMDWSTQESTLGSAFRMADNLALFHTEKLPYFVELVPENRDVLERLGVGQISPDQAKAEMAANVRAAGLDAAT